MTRALIVDDEEPARSRLRRLLAGQDVEVVAEACDGEEAIAYATTLTPDLIFLDIQMPGLSGLDVAARLPAPRPRIVFCTAYDEFAIAAFEHQALDYLLKPINRDRLHRTVERVAREVMQQRRQQRADCDALTTQQQLMPRAATLLPGIDCDGACRPAETVSGDFFDFVRIDTEHVAIAVGDVSGKGQYAALLSAAIQARLQTLVASGTLEPSEVLRQLDLLTCGRIESHRFATVFFAIVDSTNRSLTYASAGHVPALIVPTGGSVRELPSTGPAIGWQIGHPYETHMRVLAEGDVIAIYTDGITESIDGNARELGLDGLAERVVRRRHASAGEIVAGVLEDVAQFAGGAPAADDRTLVVAKVHRS